MYGESDRLKSAIDSARKEVDGLSNENQARLAQLITIWASGYLEAACREVFLIYARSRTDSTVLRYVDRNLERFSNPNTQKIVELVHNFDNDKARELEEFANNGIKESVDGIRAQRNLIAHGRSTSTTIVNATQQFEAAKKLMNKLKSLFQ